MTNEEINTAIAEAVGWKPTPTYRINLHGIPFPIFSASRPNYCTDLNAMHEAVISAKIDDRRWSDALKAVIQDEYCCGAVDARYKTVNATAPQRAEAFLRTIGKWRDEP